MSKPALVRIGHGILKRLPKTTLVNTVHKLEQLAKSKGIKSIGKIAKRVKRKARSGSKRIKRRVKRRSVKRFKTAYSSFPNRYTNGRTIKKSKMPKKYRGQKVLVAKNGRPYVLLASGQARFIKGR